MKDIALITPVFNPTDIQIDNLFKTYESLKDVVGRFYLGINNKSEKIRDIKEKSKRYNCVVNIISDNGPDDALMHLVPLIEEDFVWMFTCGEIIELHNKDFLDNICENTIVFGNTTFINKDGSTSRMNPKTFNNYYKYKIPILNLSSCIMSKKMFLASNPRHMYKVATDYEQILRMYKMNPTLRHTKSYTLSFYNDGNSTQNKITGAAEMYHLSKRFYPEKYVSRNIFYLLFLIKYRINPFKFISKLSEIEKYTN